MSIERATESEKVIIASLLEDNSLIQQASVLPDDFVNKRLGRCFDEISSIIATGDQVDAVSLFEHMRTRNGPGLDELSMLVRNNPTTSAFARHCKTVKSESVKRKALMAMREAMESIDGDDNTVDGLISKLMLLNKPKRNFNHTLKQAMLGALDMLDREAQGMRGVRTGIDRLDSQLGGFHCGDLVVVAARPGIGKTAFAVNLCLNANEPIGLFSSEQPNEQIALRTMSIDSRVPVAVMRTGMEAHEFDSLLTSQVKLKDRQIHINDEPGITIAELARQARAWKFEHNVKAIYVDYLQRIKSTLKSERKHEQVAQVAEALKELARELDIPVIALAQINRNVEDRTDKRPHLADIAESGVIEREADQVMTLYRDFVYNENTPEKDVIEINVVKNRHGPLGCIKAKWSGSCMRVSNF